MVRYECGPCHFPFVDIIFIFVIHKVTTKDWVLCGYFMKTLKYFKVFCFGVVFSFSKGVRGSLQFCYIGSIYYFKFGLYCESLKAVRGMLTAFVLWDENIICGKYDKKGLI